MEGVAVLEVDLVLALGDFVVRGLDLEPHIGEGDDDLTTDVLRKVGRGKVEVAAAVLELRSRSAAEHLKEEEFEFRPGVEDVPVLCRVLHRPPEHVARVALKRLPVGRLVDIADEPGFRVLPGPPGQEGVSREVGFEHHVGLFYPDETLDRRPVEPDTAGQRLFGLLHRDSNVLRQPQEVGELQPKKFDVILLNALKHRRSGITGHVEFYFYPMQ